MDKRKLPPQKWVAMGVAHGNAMRLPMARTASSEIALDYHLTLEVLRGGHGHEYHLGCMAQVIYMAKLLSREQEASGHAGLFCEAKAAVLRCREAGLETSIWTADEDAYVILAEILTLFDRQLASVPLHKFKNASDRLKEVFSGKRADGQDSAVNLQPPANSTRIER